MTEGILIGVVIGIIAERALKITKFLWELPRTWRDKKKK